MRYYEIIEKMGLEPWWADFIKTNSSNRLPYHNMQHTMFMIEDCYEGAMSEGLAPNLDHPLIKTLILAAIYHDWGHTGGVWHLNPKLRGAGLGPGGSDAYPDSENVKIAIEKVRSLLEIGFWPSGVSLNQVINTIRATEYPYAVPVEDLTPAGRIIRDADLQTSTKGLLIPHVVYGLSEELGYPIEVLIQGEIKFLESAELITDWGKRRWSLHLPLMIEELNVFANILQFSVGERKMIAPLDLQRLAVRVENMMRQRTHGWNPADELEFHQRLPGGYDRRKLPSPEDLRQMALDLKSHPDLHEKYRLWIATALALEDLIRENDPRNPKRMMRDMARGRF